MITISEKIKMLLQNSLKYMAVFAIALFSVMVMFSEKSLAAEFAYKDFNWDEFLEKNKAYWDGYCVTTEDKDDCSKTIIKSQKKFYTKLYKLLAKYEAKGIHIDDNIILETVFFEMSPSGFSDSGEEYKETWNTESGAYVIDETDEDMDDDFSEETAEYYATEKDTLKILIKNMIAYDTSCYGLFQDPTEHEADDGSKSYTCDAGGEITFVKGKRRCAGKVGGGELGFWKYYISKWTNDLGKATLSFLGQQPVDEYYESCKAQKSNFVNGTQYIYEDNPHASTVRYWEFLHHNRYFDNKAHLQSYFKEDVLIPAEVDCLTDVVCDNSLESKGLYDQYLPLIEERRKFIIDNIIGILERYGIDAPYDAMSGTEFEETNREQATRKSFYWPIGSDETEERDGVVYADGEPASTTVISYFGERKSPSTGETENHYGIDISGIEGNTNVVAVYNGEVISIVDGCTAGDYTCNEGYGNMIILSHSNGDYTVYAHLFSIDSSVTVGAGVKKGQLIGSVGKTGNVSDAALHYELRVGGNDIEHAVDPLGYSDSKNPRPHPSSSGFSVHETSLTREEFISRMSTYCSHVKCNRTMLDVFVPNAGLIYDTSISANVNPELVVVRAINEGFSPGGNTNNYWGIRCYNGGGVKACSTYSSLEAGIRGFAGVVSGYEDASDMMLKYAYIGKYWYNPGSWSLGGCPYFPYISEYMPGDRVSVATSACSGPTCTNDNTGSCTRTTDEDQRAYATWQVADKMLPIRYNLFGV